jgi:hypothetical protein
LERKTKIKDLRYLIARQYKNIAIATVWYVGIKIDIQMMKYSIETKAVHTHMTNQVLMKISRWFNKERKYFQQIMLEQLEIHKQKKKL